MRQRAATVARDVLEDVDIECTHCGVIMSGYQTPASGLRYYRCGCCHRWVSSAYAEVLGAGAKVRTQPRREQPRPTGRMDAVKDRLEKWLASLEVQDPYRTLGVSPNDPAERIRSRYHELALQCHPDRGGSVEKMRELNVAYERITHHLERRASEELSASSSLNEGALPARSR
jgi:hypothetical protein